VYILGYIHVFFFRISYNFKNAVLKNSKKGLHGAWVPKRFFGVSLSFILESFPFCGLYNIFSLDGATLMAWENGRFLKKISFHLL
jgi:hypothetical protein